jgi:4-carboxymuconolactone decarboxylase
MYPSLRANGSRERAPDDKLREAIQHWVEPEIGLLRRFAPRNDRRISMDDQKRRDDGMTQRRKVLGDAWVDQSAASKNSFNAEFLDLITRHAWGEIWTRPHFDQRTRRVLVIGTLVALGQWDEFRLHVRAALTEGGFTPDDIKEILLQQAIYCGVPAANHAVKEASAIVRELGLLKG